MALTFFIFSNLGIVFGYGFIGGFVLPRTTEFVRRLIPGVELHMNVTTFAGMVFFLTCALTHLEHALHVTFQPDETVTHVAQEGHMLLVHGAQVVAVWALIIGLLVEFVRPVSKALYERGITR